MGCGSENKTQSSKKMIWHNRVFHSLFVKFRTEISRIGKSTACSLLWGTGKVRLCSFLLECGRFSSKVRSWNLNIKVSQNVQSITVQIEAADPRQKTGSLESKCTSPGQKCVSRRKQKPTTSTNQPKSKKTEPEPKHKQPHNTCHLWGRELKKSPHCKMENPAWCITSVQKEVSSWESRSRSGRVCS